MEEICAAIAGRAHGVVTRRELLAAGVSRREIATRTASGALIAVFPGVYRVGHAAPSVLARYMAAVKACGEGAVLCGAAAGHLHAILRSAPRFPHVLALTERRLERVVVRRARAGIDSRDVTRVRGISVTTVARTLVDLAGSLGEEALAGACHEADVRHRVTPAEVLAVLSRRPTAAGARTLRRILVGDGHVVLSALERRFLALLREAGLPLPQTNIPVGAHYVDCRWPEHGVTVELDSYRYHNTRRAWERDRERERAARARGDVHRRYTAADIFDRPGPMLADLRGLLVASS